MQVSPTRELTLEFPIEKIQSCIDEIIKVSTGSYILQDKNQIFGTYRIYISQGLNPGTMNITLTKIDENKTRAVFEMIKLGGSQAQPSAQAGMMDGFLQILSSALSGQPITKTLIKSKKGGCLGILVAIIIASILITFLSSCAQSPQQKAEATVKQYMEKNLREPDSYKPDHFSGFDSLLTPAFSGYKITHYYRAHNSFGASILSIDTFYLTPALDSVTVMKSPNTDNL